MAHPRYRINLAGGEEHRLHQLIRKHGTPQVIAKRARIVLLANGDDLSNREIGERLGIGSGDVTYWLKRWIECAFEPLEKRLGDRGRSGRPATITPEQWTRIIALACEPPEKYGRPITHWTSRELAEEVVEQQIVSTLSEGYLRKVLKKHNCNRTGAAIGSMPKPMSVKTSVSPRFVASMRPA
jgi:putative transposase